jgi:hypothetical protein
MPWGLTAQDVIDKNVGAGVTEGLHELLEEKPPGVAHEGPTVGALP